jgi:RNA polymerase sigma factor (sigma-70 family)
MLKKPETKEERDQMILRNIKVVHYVVNRVTIKTPIPYDDLISIGTLILITSIDKIPDTLKCSEYLYFYNNIRLGIMREIMLYSRNNVETVLMRDIPYNELYRGYEYTYIDRFDIEYNDEFSLSFKDKILEIFDTILPIEKHVVYYSFFEDKSVAWIAKKYCLHPHTIRRIMKRALRKLRHPSRSNLFTYSDGIRNIYGSTYSDGILNIYGSTYKLTPFEY